MTEITLDFGGAPPVASASTSDRIPEGQYLLQVGKVEKQVTKTAKDMLVASLMVVSGDFKGKRLSENFVMPRPNSDDSKFGLQRFHGLLVALGFREMKGKAKVVLESLSGKKCLADVGDETMPASGDYPERIRSRPLAFYPVNASAPAAAEAKPTAKAKAAPAREPLPEPEPEVVEEPEMAEAVEEAVATDEPSTGLDDLFDGIE